MPFPSSPDLSHPLPYPHAHPRKRRPPSACRRARATTEHSHPRPTLSFLRRQSLPLRRQGNLAPSRWPFRQGRNPAAGPCAPSGGMGAAGPQTESLKVARPDQAIPSRASLAAAVQDDQTRLCLPEVWVQDLPWSFHTPLFDPCPYLQLPAGCSAHPFRGLVSYLRPTTQTPRARHNPKLHPPLKGSLNRCNSKLPRLLRVSTPQAAPRHPRHGGVEKTRSHNSKQSKSPALAAPRRSAVTLTGRCPLE